MQRNYLVAIVFSIAILIVGFACESKASAAEETEVLKITVGEPTKLSDLVNQNTASLSVSRTGVVAAFYPKPGTGPKFYRTSTDGGVTWGPEMSSPPQMGGGQCSGMLLGGGNIRPVGPGGPIAGEPGWFQAPFLRFNDDFSDHSIETSRIYMPGAITKKIEGRHYVWNWPGFAARIITLDNGDLMAAMYGLFEGDAVGAVHGSRVIAVRSNDDGRTWRYQGTVSNRADDPDPQLPGIFAGFTESNIAYLPDGQLLCIMRSQGSHYPGEYKPLYVSWSEDMGKTWTKPKPTQPHLMNILPTLVVLDNGVVACQHGRPGFNVSFSLDNGHTWQDRISLSDLPVDVITGQFDMRKSGPNSLLAIGSDGEGTKVWPITVERVKVSPAHVALQGRVLDQQGNPIAGALVEAGPNRYALDSWLEDATQLDIWKAGPLTIGTPKLSYLSIRKPNGYPTVQTDKQGRFHFESVKLSEYILTVEADGYAPQHRHIKVEPEPQTHSQQFQLKAGRSVRGRVVERTGKPVGGACVVLDRWHIHADSDGFFSWAIDSPVPNEVTVRVYKRYNGDYKAFEKELSPSRIEGQPIILLLRRENPASATVRVSGNYGSSVPAEVFDGTGGWAAGGFGPQWIQKDLERVVKVKAIHSDFGTYNKGDSVTYKIEGSLDEKTWQVLVPEKNTTTGKGEDLFSPPVNTRFIRTTILKVSSEKNPNGEWVGMSKQNIEVE